MATVTLLRTHVIKPLLAAADTEAQRRTVQNPTPLDHHYDALRVGMQSLFHELGIAA